MLSLLGGIMSIVGSKEADLKMRGAFLDFIVKQGGAKFIQAKRVCDML